MLWKMKNDEKMKNAIQRGVGQLSTTSHSWLMEVIPDLWKFCCFLGKINTQIYEDFEKYFATTQEFLASKKYRKCAFE